MPEDTAVVFGQDLVLNCDYVEDGTNQTEFNYTWQLNNEPIPEKASIFTNHSILVPDMQTTDLGQYSCIVNSSVNDSVTSPDATVIHACKYLHKQITAR